MKKIVSFMSVLLLPLLLFVGCVTEPTPSASDPHAESTSATATSTQVTETQGTTVTVSQPTDGTTTDGTTTANTTVAPTTKPATTTVTTTTQATTVDWKKNYTAKQILRDNTFQNGFNVNGQEERKPIGTWYNTDSEENTVWGIGQWGTFNSYTDRSGYQCLLRDRLETPKNILSNGINTLTYNDERKSLTFTMNTYEFYGGQGHVDNSSWPHLLISQDIIDRETFFNLEDEDMTYYSPAADKVIISLDVRLTSFSHEPLEGINACQFLSFYYVKSLRDSGFIWFGMPIFDDRGYNQNQSEVRFQMDKGSGCYICSIPQVQVYNSTRADGRYDFFSYDDISVVEPSEEWMHIELDLKPYLDMMAEKAMKGSAYNVFKNTTDIRDLYFSGMNLGFEVHGTYDVSFEIMNYAITTYVKK